MHNSSHPVKSQTAANETALPQIELLPPSLTLRVGNRRLTLSYRARKPLPQLLFGLLRRSWRSMFGNSLRITVAAAAVCAAWNTNALAAAPPVNTLPTGGTVTYGNATFTQTGNTLTINQTTNQAIANFTTFSIGANAVVDINQPSAAAAFLARVTGTDPSLIYGLLKSNGTVALINQNGILIGPGGVVDVARFIASTINLSDSDFLAGRLTFNSGGNVVGNVDNQGTIKTASGGSVYLIGSNVSNSGVIQSPNGEIILAAGQSVELVDTGTPGVTVNVTGAAGNVTNLGTITAAAGTIGIVAGLINNSGVINASNVVADGGRVFLRASQQLTTTANSAISADGVNSGGSVVLYSAGGAYIDGTVSATGAAGKGGYVETSGLTSLDVVKAPTVGSGGTWYIDPYDLTVVADTTANNNVDSNLNTITSVITSNGSSSYIRASDIDGQLNQGANVTLVTGAGGAATGGNITVNSAIEKTSGSGATLTLNADNNIVINASISSTSSTLNLSLNTNYQNATTGTHSAQVNDATIALNGGALKVSDGTGGNGNGNLSLNGISVLNLSGSGGPPMGGSLILGNLTVGAGSTVTSSNGSDVEITGVLNNNGTFYLSNATGSIGGTITNGGTMTLTNMFRGFSTAAIVNNNSGTLNLINDGTSGLTIAQLSNSGLLNVSQGSLGITGTLSNLVTGTVNVTDALLSTNAVNNAGTFNVSNSTILSPNAFINTITGTVNANDLSNFASGSFINYNLVNLNSSVAFQMLSSMGVINAVNATLNVVDIISNSGTFNITNSSVSTGNGFTNNMGGTINANYLATFQSGAVLNNGVLNLNSSVNRPGNDDGTGIVFNAGLTNAGTMTVLGNVSSSGSIINTAAGTIAIGGNNGAAVVNADLTNAGTVSVLGAVSSNGTIVNAAGGTITVGSNNVATTFDISSGNGIWLNHGNLSVASGSFINGTSLSNDGSVKLNDGSLWFGTITNAVGGTLSGTGTVDVALGAGTFTNAGVLAPGGDGTIGSLTINGAFAQTDTGTLLIDVASTANALTSDQLVVTSSSDYILAGTLQTKLMAGSTTPALGTTFMPIEGGNAAGYFRHVLGDVLNVSGALQMFKASYNYTGKKLALTMAGSEDFTFTAGDGGAWGSVANWNVGNSVAGALPTAIDNIIVNSGTLNHNVSDGVDIVNNISVVGANANLTVSGGTLTANNVTSSGSLALSGGTMTVGNLSSTGTVTIGTVEGPGGSLTVNGLAQMNALALNGFNYFLKGGDSSTISVNGTFDQAGGGVINSSGNVVLTQLGSGSQSGFTGFSNFVSVGNNGADDLVVGNITAGNLVLVSVAGAISQTNTLHVKKQLITSSATGTTLDNSNNQIAAYSGINTGSGDIVLVNNLNTTDTSNVTIGGITNNNGSISVDNTGAMRTAAITTTGSSAIDAFATALGVAKNGSVTAKTTSGSPTAQDATVTLATHSPLTIGGNVTANGNINLSAGDGTSVTDILAINGNLSSASGAVSLTANSITYATPVAAVATPPASNVSSAATSTLISSVNNSQSTNSTSTSSSTSTPASNTTSSTTFTTSSGQTMTTGGDTDTFGGSDSNESGSSSSSSSSSSSGSSSASSKVAKMYCN